MLVVVMGLLPAHPPSPPSAAPGPCFIWDVTPIAVVDWECLGLRRNKMPLRPQRLMNELVTN